ncbi:asparagine-rich antigen, putative [Plasmodium berghei]|uniref:histone acetyltransferase n=2 Tax=Plasmodium berghei TaxID=5821 RepID=A0A509AUF4_PLABA|nr:asparagine-rich antigen, putative [Plasmodium berghei ANKA]CXJ18591.1 asparagine-rich antigen, putative [Plasmodium berghei]SCM26439.1 asparagine-rich antigen, putative [Plasmodium berghei]SCN28459.1 asparagine-rich antigen, putative [Plasmodium berghei]SCO62649.1 asparagine-rich antigen, putative [Plasmodium berghei]SCO64210.1 asparagine-rich antigen, putative [Plasmodium berghei]|eukprot:XP_034424105.1 asparagine-rich antigen, putative [Plasmodium berghei ANKA]
MDKIKENNNDNSNASKNKDFDIKNAESMNIKNSFIEFQYDKVVNNILGLFKKLSKQRLVSTSSALRDDMDKQILNSQLFLDLCEDREILLNKILKKINILNLVYFRFLKETDIDDTFNLHKELFPVKYHADFYFSICNFDDNKIVDDDVIKITEKISKEFGTTLDNKKYAKYCDNYKKTKDSILKNKVSTYDNTPKNTNDDEQSPKKQSKVPNDDDNNKSDNEKDEKELCGKKYNPQKNIGIIKNYSNINSNKKKIIHKKWRADEIFSIGAFLPYSFIDYINNDSITDLIKNKTIEKLTEKEILLDYIQFLDKCDASNENDDINIKSPKKKTNSFSDNNLSGSNNNNNDINYVIPNSQEINDNCKKGNNDIKNNHTFLNSHKEPSKKENNANFSTLSEEYSNIKKESNKYLQNDPIKITNNSNIQDIYNHLGKKNLRYEEINGISHNRNDDVKLTNGKKYFDKEMLNSFNYNMNNISYKKERKNYLIGSISCLINYGDFNDDKDYINIYNHFMKNYINNKNEKSHIKNMCKTSMNFLENCISLEKNNDNDIGDEINEEHIDDVVTYNNMINEDDNNSAFSTNLNDLKNPDYNLFTIDGKKKSKKKKNNNNNVLKELTVLKMKGVHTNPQFEKKLYEEIYMNKNINEITKKYLTGNINNIYILTVGISEYFRGLNLASYLIEYTIYYFYFIIYRIFLYNNKLYCYVDNDVFYNLSNNIVKDENYNEGILYDNPTDSFPSVIKIEEKKKKKKHENNYHDQAYNSQICEESCKNYIHTSSKKEKLENKEQKHSGKLINEEKREDSNIRTEDYIPCNGKDPLYDDNNLSNICNGTYPKNYSLCNSIIINLYKNVVLNDYLHDLYSIIHGKNFKNMKYKENENMPFTTNFCKQFPKENNIVACSNITDEVFNIFFNELSAYNLKKNKKILIKRYNTTNLHDGGENKAMPLYIYLHVIDYNKAAINLYNKLKFDYIDKYDNFYVINKINFSSYLYSYFF